MHYMYVSLNYDLMYNICGPQQLTAVFPLYYPIHFG
jgi:hypothetical protein